MSENLEDILLRHQMEMAGFRGDPKGFERMKRAERRRDVLDRAWFVFVEMAKVYGFFLLAVAFLSACVGGLLLIASCIALVSGWLG